MIFNKVSCPESKPKTKLLCLQFRDFYLMNVVSNCEPDHWLLLENNTPIGKVLIAQHAFATLLYSTRKANLPNKAVTKGIVAV